MSDKRPQRRVWQSQLYDPDVHLSVLAIAVGGCICEKVNDKTGIAWPGYAHLGECLGVKSENTIRKAIVELERAGLLDVLRVVGHANSYRLILREPLANPLTLVRGSEPTRKRRPPQRPPHQGAYESENQKKPAGGRGEVATTEEATSDLAKSLPLDVSRPRPREATGGEGSA